MEEMPGVVSLTRVESFSAAHRLHSVHLSEEENRLEYGKCNHANFHGHNYKVEVTMRGEVNERTGMLINLVDVKRYLKEAVMDQLDHKNVDLDIQYFRESDKTSSVENMCVFIWEQLYAVMEKEGNQGKLHKVKLWETEKNCASYKGKQPLIS